VKIGAFASHHPFIQSMTALSRTTVTD